MQEKVMLDTSGKARMHVEVRCEGCGKMFWKPKRFMARASRHCCSVACVAAIATTSTQVKCAQCGTEFTKIQSTLCKSKSGLYFCSRKCKDMSQRTENGGKSWNPQYTDLTGKNVYRDIALRNYPEKCACCGYDEHKEGLEVHHIDGDRTNNAVKNLMILCALCHRLVTNKVYKVVNREVIK